MASVGQIKNLSGKKIIMRCKISVRVAVELLLSAFELVDVLRARKQNLRQTKSIRSSGRWRSVQSATFVFFPCIGQKKYRSVFLIFRAAKRCCHCYQGFIMGNYEPLLLSTVALRLLSKSR